MIGGQPVTVAKAPLTITAGSASKTYGHMFVLPDAFMTTGTLYNGDTLTSVTLTSAGTSLTANATAAGSHYAIVPSAAVGTGLANYNITYVNGALTVMPVELTITAAGGTKVYDGTTSSAAVPTITSGSLVLGETANFTETYATRNVGTDLSLTPGGTVNDGNGGNNYTYTFKPESTGVITAEALTITAVPNTKIYDRTTAAAAVPTITLGSLGAGDTAIFSETYSTPNVGTGLTLTPGGTVNDGNGGNNYTYKFVRISTGTIIAALPTVVNVTKKKSAIVVQFSGRSM